MDRVSSVGHWYRCGDFANADEARGVFKLAYRQHVDGMGASAEEWMGLTTADFYAWMRDGSLPPIDHWYLCGHFASLDDARLAFKLAYQQHANGMGASAATWMGLSPSEFEAWTRDGTFPPNRALAARGR